MTEPRRASSLSQGWWNQEPFADVIARSASFAGARRGARDCVGDRIGTLHPHEITPSSLISGTKLTGPRHARTGEATLLGHQAEYERARRGWPHERDT